MKVREIYKKYKIPPNLQEHMLRVTKIALFITDHWRNHEIDKDLILKAGLLHDLGNIVKFQMEKHPDFLGEEEKRLQYWLKVQKEMIKKYGDDDHLATGKMLEESGIDSEVLQIIMKKSFHQAVKMEKANNWTLKVLFYADLRVGPLGIVPLKERFNEAIPRLKMYKETDYLDGLVKACYQIEKQIQANLEVDVSKITEETLKADDKELLNTEIQNH